MQTTVKPACVKGKKGVSYAKWGYIFILPFFVTYCIFSLAPQVLTIYNSFFENYREGLTQVGPKFVGFQNYVKLFTPDKNGSISILKFTANTLLMWIEGAVPQVLIALLLSVFFTSYRLKIKGQQFFKTVIYMPNLIMASAFSMLFFTLFSNVGPVNQLLVQLGWIDEAIPFFDKQITVRGLVATMNFLMWFGNTTILLMAGIMGIDQNLFEAANLDGANSLQVFFRVTLPLLMPVLVYTIITALIGGLQMFDVPQVLTNGAGTPNRSSTTLIMYLNNFLKTSKNYGMAGAVSVIIFIITGLLSILVFKSLTKDEMRKIVDLQLQDLRNRMEEGKHLKLEVTTAAKDFIIDSAYDSVYGARPIKRFIQSRVETLIAKAIIKGSYAEGDTLTVDFDGSALVLR